MAICQCAHVPGDLPPIVVAKSSVSDFRIKKREAEASPRYQLYAVR